MAVFVLQLLALLSFLYIFCVAVYMYNMLSMLMSSIPNKVCPFPGTTKNLHIFCLLLFSIFTLHMPNCIIIILLYVLDVTYFLLLPVVLLLH